MKTNLTAQEVRELFRLDAETGLLWWSLRRRGLPRNKPAGSINHRGYRVITVFGEDYYAHRLVWLHVHGHWPAADVDHENTVKGDNRPRNLRSASRQQNKWNVGLTKANRSGVKGVSFDAQRGKWFAAIRIDGRQKNLGRYVTQEEAGAAYAAAAAARHGAFLHQSITR